MSAPSGELSRARTPVLLLAGLTAVGLLAGTLMGWKVMARPAPAPVLHA
ncbi:MAG: hypothetical protein IPH09_10915 [bacterium]|nr:hypothetical protein [bacterium]